MTQSRYPNAEAEIDQEALAAFAALSPVVGSIDRDVASAVGLGVVRHEWDEDLDLGRMMHDDFIKQIAAELELLDVRTIGELKTQLWDNRADIVEFARKHLERPIADGRVGGLLHGLSLRYLTRIMAGRTLDVEEVKRYLRTGGRLNLNPSGEDEEARRIVEIVQSIDQEQS